MYGYTGHWNRVRQSGSRRALPRTSDHGPDATVCRASRRLRQSPRFRCETNAVMQCAQSTKCAFAPLALHSQCCGARASVSVLRHVHHTHAAAREWCGGGGAGGRRVLQDSILCRDSTSDALTCGGASACASRLGRCDVRIGGGGRPQRARSVLAYDWLLQYFGMLKFCPCSVPPHMMAVDVCIAPDRTRCDAAHTTEAFGSGDTGAPEAAVAEAAAAGVAAAVAAEVAAAVAAEAAAVEVSGGDGHAHAGAETSGGAACSAHGISSDAPRGSPRSREKVRSAMLHSASFRSPK